MRAADPRLSELWKQVFEGVKRTNPERRSRLSFLVARSQRIVVGTELPALADALQGLVVSEGAIHDADGRLVLDRDGGFDPRAFAPRSLLVFGDLEGKHRVSRGLPTTRLGRGFVFDGWACYDSTGRALLTHSRKLDPGARLP